MVGRVRWRRARPYEAKAPSFYLTSKRTIEVRWNSRHSVAGFSAQHPAVDDDYSTPP